MYVRKAKVQSAGIVCKQAHRAVNTTEPLHAYTERYMPTYTARRHSVHLQISRVIRYITSFWRADGWYSQRATRNTEAIKVGAYM